MEEYGNVIAMRRGARAEKSTEWGREQEQEYNRRLGMFNAYIQNSETDLAVLRRSEGYKNIRKVADLKMPEENKRAINAISPGDLDSNWCREPAECLAVFDSVRGVREIL